MTNLNSVIDTLIQVLGSFDAIAQTVVEDNVRLSNAINVAFAKDESLESVLSMLDMEDSWNI